MQLYVFWNTEEVYRTGEIHQLRSEHSLVKIYIKNSKSDVPNNVNNISNEIKMY